MILQVLEHATCLLIADFKSKVHWMGLLGLDASFLVPDSSTTPRLCLQVFLCTSPTPLGQPKSLPPAQHLVSTM